jgi:hypothetical protein
VEHHGAAARRVRHRQGADRQRHPLQLAARAGGALRQAQLRRAARQPAGVGAVRPREGRLHRRPEQRKGRFEQADGGTLFLDEIGEITPAFQAKLLRVLQEGEFERVGGSRTLKVDVRVIAATNRNLEQEVKDGDFREDLYYRLNVMPIVMPALRERIEDVPDLARFLVAKVAKQQGRELSITDSALRVLMRHDWPGNVRELENCMERAAVMSESGIIDRDVINLTGLDVGALPEPPVPSAPSAAGAAASTSTTRPRRARARHRRPGAGRLGAGQGRAPAEDDAAPDRLSHPDPEHPPRCPSLRLVPDATGARGCAVAKPTAGLCDRRPTLPDPPYIKHLTRPPVLGTPLA